MRTKYDIGSFADVFINPFYWQLFHLMPRAPRQVIDCGAHCGHFSVLADRCIRARFPDAQPRFVLIEPNPRLQTTICGNLADAGIAERAEVHRVLLGSTEGTGTLWVNTKNYLASRIEPFDGATPYEVPFRTLASILNNRDADVLKIDIEGAEFELVRTQLATFARVGLLMMEVHGSDSECDGLLKQLKEVGLELCLSPIEHTGFKLLALARRPVGTAP